MDAQEKLEDEKMRWGCNPTAEQMETLLDDVFYKVVGFVPVTKYEESEGSGIIEADE